MREIVKIPAGHYGNCSRPFFWNTGLAGYFSIATEIPQEAFDVAVPRKCFTLFFGDERVSRAEIKREKYFLPSLEQSLWAIGFATIDTMNAICQKPARFMHRPFKIPHNNSKGRDVWRQILVRRVGTGYSLETVSVADKSTDSSFVYVLF